ncbi:MAG: hypothetical protein LBE76_06495 [Nitrososphaerota archaeon]|jgi:imidazoleglycerol phosphate synthase glutamine amidotransferase subunit HisH|nr:hypothetical protein [Nitrososphaerota archaeon]
MQKTVIFDYGVDVLSLEETLEKVEMGVYVGTSPNLMEDVVIPLYSVGTFTSAIKRPSAFFDGVTEYAFVFSFYTEFVEASVMCDRTMYCVTFSSVAVNNVVGSIQFYPEMSGDVDLQFLRNFIRLVAR